MLQSSPPVSAVGRGRVIEKALVVLEVVMTWSRLVTRSWLRLFLLPAET